MTSSARWRKPGLHAGEGLEEGHGVGEHVGADDLADRPAATAASPRLTTRMPPRAGSIISRNSRWSRKRASTPERLEEVERVAARRRVDDDEVEALVAVQLVQRLGRHVLLRAATARRRCCGRTVLARIRSACSSSPALRRTTRVERRRRVEHHRPQLAGDVGQRRSAAARCPGRRADRARRPGVAPGRSSRRRPAGRAAPPPARSRRRSSSCRRRPTRSTRRPRRRRGRAVERGHAGSRAAR